MAEDLTVPDPAPVMELLEAFRRSKVMFAAVSLGVFDRLQQSSASLAELSRDLKASEDGLERLLDTCVGMGLLSKSADIYSATPVSNCYLTSTSPRRMTGYIQYSNDVMWKLWGCLEDAVREGSHRWKQVYGWDRPIFSSFFRTEEATREFLMGMHGFGLVSSPAVVNAFDLSRFQTFVDLGGATGHLAIAACRRYSNLKGVVFDLPEAIPLAKEIVSQSEVASRIELVAGDFFEGSLPPADIYALGRIVHDWSEEKIDRLFQKIYASLPAGGAILIAEKVLVTDKTGPRWAQLQSLNMLTCTEGKERSLEEYELLLTHHGFERVAAVRTNAPLDAVIAYKS